MTEALRRKQIREILDEDLRINRIMLDRTFKSARIYDRNSFKEPSPMQELVSWNIDKQISMLQEAIQNVIDSVVNNQYMTITNEDISKIGIAYNLVISYIGNFAKRHKIDQRDKSILDNKFLELIPLLEQVKYILENPDSYNTTVDAQNLHIITHIEDQIKDSNYRGLQVIDYKRIPVQKGRLNPARHNTPTRRQDDNEPLPLRNRQRFQNQPYEPREQNESLNNTSNFVRQLQTREGTPSAEDRAMPISTYSPKPTLNLSPQILNQSLSNLKSSSTPKASQKDSNKRPTRTPDARIPSQEALASSLRTLRHTTPKNLAHEEDDPTNYIHAPTPFSKLPKENPQFSPAMTISLPAMTRKFTFKKLEKNGNQIVHVNNQPILDENGTPIDQDTWSQKNAGQKTALIEKTLSGKGKGKKKQYQRGQKASLQYDPDRNNLWAD